jgi:hypothetical protein
VVAVDAVGTADAPEVLDVLDMPDAAVMVTLMAVEV